MWLPKGLMSLRGGTFARLLAVYLPYPLSSARQTAVDEAMYWFK